MRTWGLFRVCSIFLISWVLGEAGLLSDHEPIVLSCHVILWTVTGAC